MTTETAIKTISDRRFDADGVPISADDEAGMQWWNSMSKRERLAALEQCRRATGREPSAKEAWEVHRGLLPIAPPRRDPTMQAIDTLAARRQQDQPFVIQPGDVARVVMALQSHAEECDRWLYAELAAGRNTPLHRRLRVSVDRMNGLAAGFLNGAVHLHQAIVGGLP